MRRHPRPGRAGRWGFRWRLTALFAALVAGSLTLFATIVYLLVLLIPSGAFASLASATATDQADGAGGAGGAGAVDGSTAVALDQQGVTSLLGFDQLLHILLLVSIGTVVVVGLVGAGTGWWVAGRVVQPLEAVTAVARRASGGDLGARVGGPARADEFGVLGASVDDMLDALTRSLAAHERFAANASHELRTPLATTQTLIEVTLADPEVSADDLRALVERLGEVNRRHLATVEALLDLADAQNLPARARPLALGPLVDDVVETLDAAAREAGVSVEAATPSAAQALADPVLLRQALLNLVGNAVRHNEAGGWVRVAVDAVEHEVRVRIENTGRTLTPAQVATVTEPFVRDGGRASSAGAGRGLGLAVVVAIAASHHGRLDLEARAGGGLSAVLVLPRADSSVAVVAPQT